jgi:hypothetical protein
LYDSKTCGFGGVCLATELDTKEIHSLIFLEVRNPKSVSLGQNNGVGRDASPVGALENSLFLASLSFWWLPGILCLMAASLQALSTSLLVSNFSLEHVSGTMLKQSLPNAWS